MNWYDLTREQRKAIYLQDRKFWREKVRIHFSASHFKLKPQVKYTIMLLRLEKGKTLDAVGKKVHLSRERIRQIEAKALLYVAKSSQRKDIQEQLKAFRASLNYRENKLTQEEFDRIKQLLWEGNTYTEVASVSGRDAQIAARVNKAETLEQYFQDARDRMKKYMRERKQQSEINKAKLRKQLTSDTL